MLLIGRFLNAIGFACGLYGFVLRVRCHDEGCNSALQSLIYPLHRPRHSTRNRLLVALDLAPIAIRNDLCYLHHWYPRYEQGPAD